jgi:hypothetical protein
MTNATKSLQREAQLRRAYDYAYTLEPTLRRELRSGEEQCQYLLLRDYAASKGLSLPGRN